MMSPTTALSLLLVPLGTIALVWLAMSLYRYVRDGQLSLATDTEDDEKFYQQVLAESRAQAVVESLNSDIEALGQARFQQADFPTERDRLALLDALKAKNPHVKGLLIHSPTELSLTFAQIMPPPIVTFSDDDEEDETERRMTAKEWEEDFLAGKEAVVTALREELRRDAAVRAEQEAVRQQALIERYSIMDDDKLAHTTAVLSKMLPHEDEHVKACRAVAEARIDALKAGAPVRFSETAVEDRLVDDALLNQVKEELEALERLNGRFTAFAAGTEIINEPTPKKKRKPATKKKAKKAKAKRVRN